MRQYVLFPLLGCLLFSYGAIAAETTTKAPSEAQLAQRQKMADCNKDAATKSLKGDDRKAFMSNCLKDKPVPMNKPSSQQEKMKSCNAEAGNKALKGDERKTFMSTCLKKAA